MAIAILYRNLWGEKDLHVLKDMGCNGDLARLLGVSYARDVAQ